ncbi:MAG: NAD(P)H-dependent oxidoreductase [Rhodobacteraceae bacterium]|nr:NAD(P)H-dependent oxidoreductase [Paracoccaceae bacterium]
MPRLLAISGSLRKASRNTALLHEAIRLFGDCTVDIADLRLPLYDGDVEDAHGLPDKVRTLNAQIRAADAIVIATPEYNKMIPGVLKNALDWISRDKPQPLIGKPVAIVSAAGRSGGEVAQFTLRHALASFNTNLLQGAAFVVPDAAAAFGEDGRLLAESQQSGLHRLMARLRAEIEGDQAPE